jgi:prophage regulatory protein
VKGKANMVIGFTRFNESMYSDMYLPKAIHFDGYTRWVQPTGRDHCPALSITDDMPECGGGGGGVTDGVEVAASDDDEGGDDDGEPARRSSLKKPIPSGKHRNVTATAGALLVPQNPDIALWRLPTVLAHIPVSRSGWWAGVKTGRYPQPVKLSTRCVAWRSQDIAALIASF